MAKKAKPEKDAKPEKQAKSAKGLESLIANLQKNFGDEGIFHGDMPVKPVETISSGSLTLDLTLGVGGYPLGRIVEIYGPEASGKTTLTLHAIAEAQKAGYTCAFIDAEHALDPIYAKAIGVDLKKLIIMQPNNGEDALDAAIQIAESGQVQVIVIDSVAALTPKAEIDGEMGDNNVGLHARIMSKSMRKITGPLSKNNVLAIFINQFRMKIGVMYGDPRTTTGGESLKYYASMRLDVKRGETFKEGDVIVGGTVDVRVKKNKLATPYTECAVPVKYGKGIDKIGDIYTVAKEMGVIDARGAHHYFEGEKIGASKNETLEKLREDKKLMDKVAKLTREAHKKRMLGDEGVELEAKAKKAKAMDDDEDTLDPEELADE